MSGMKLFGLVAMLSVALVGCSPDPSVATCERQAQQYGAAVTVAASRSTTVQAVRDLQPNLQPARWPELAAESLAALCYLDGPFGDAPGGGPPYDRAVVAVAGEQADMIILGYADEMPLPST